MPSIIEVAVSPISAHGSPKSWSCFKPKLTGPGAGSRPSYSLVIGIESRLLPQIW
jgi:hypothetical protein